MENNDEKSLVAQLMGRNGKSGGHDGPERAPLGQVTAADTERGVTVHLRREQPVELLRQGQFVVVEGQHVRFFGTINFVPAGDHRPHRGHGPARQGLGPGARYPFQFDHLRRVQRARGP